MKTKNNLNNKGKYQKNSVCNFMIYEIINMKIYKENIFKFF